MSDYPEPDPIPPPLPVFNPINWPQLDTDVVVGGGGAGTQGFQGIVGAGFQGLQGFQGFAGVSGVQGLQGLQGLQGVQGIAGGNINGDNYLPSVFSSVIFAGGATGIQASVFDRVVLPPTYTGEITSSQIAGTAWLSPSPTFITNGDYGKIAVSYTGQYQIYNPDNGSGVYVSNDYGKTWTFVAISGNTSIHCNVSSTGKYMLVMGRTALYLSSNYGVSFTSILTGFITNNFNNCFMSGDAKIIYCSSRGTGLYRSIDYGTTFQLILVDATSSFYDRTVMCSNNGQYVVLGGFQSLGGGQMRVSNDYGNTFRTLATSVDAYGLAMSANGQFQYINYGSVNYRSEDYGQTFSSIATAPLSISADGRICVSISGNNLLISKDYGATYTAIFDYTTITSFFNSLTFIQISGDGNRIVELLRGPGGFTPNNQSTVQIPLTLVSNDQYNIVLNATNTCFPFIGGTGGGTGFYVSPIRGNTASNILYYNTSSKEITYDVAGGVQGLQGLQGLQGIQGDIGPFPIVYTQTYGATTTFDIDTNGALQKVVLTGSPTLAVTVSTNRAFVLLLEQDGVGNHTVTWFTTINWAGGTPPTLTTAGNKTDAFGFIQTSAGNYLGYVIGLNA